MGVCGQCVWSVCVVSVCGQCVWSVCVVSVCGQCMFEQACSVVVYGYACMVVMWEEFTIILPYRTGLIVCLSNNDNAFLPNKKINKQISEEKKLAKFFHSFSNRTAHQLYKIFFRNISGGSPTSESK